MATGVAVSPTADPFPKDRISVVEKQIDRLRKEGDDRMNSNHTLWRAGLAGIGAFILFKESIDFSRIVVALPILGMGLAAHWLNQLLTLYRAGDAMAVCEARINRLADDKLLDHELVLAHMRRLLILRWKPAIVMGAVIASVVYWGVVAQVQPPDHDVPGSLLRQLGLLAALLVHVVAAINLRRFLRYSWPGLTGAEETETVRLSELAKLRSVAGAPPPEGGAA
jgi:hypothetical protein